MKVIKFLLSFSVTLALTVAFSIKIQDIPPLGKFLDPFHGFWQNAESKETNLVRNLEFDSLRAPVTVLYDSLLVPHIFARNEGDLFYAQGYVMASLRLWQMEFVTHVASGRVSEIVGAQALKLDRLNRRKGLTYAAEKNIEVWMEDPDIRQQVESYVAGVNAFIRQLSYEDFPIEYKLLDYRPEPWTALKCALLLSYMTDMLAGGDADLQNTNALKMLGKENFDLLFPTDLPNPATVIPDSKKWDFNPVPVDTPRIAVADTTSFIMDIIDQPDPDNGSNNWAVDSSKTSSGKPMMASDPHLGLNIPSIWTAMQLNAPGFNVMGVTLPGTPGIIIGFNDSIAWGVTNARRDVLDWYKISFTNKEKTEYTYDNKQLKTRERVEQIKVLNGETFFDTVTYTHFGPVVYDDSFPADTVINNRRNFAMKWIGHEPFNGALAFYLLNRANNYDDFKRAMNYHYAPAQNFAFASASGDIAMWVQGRFPAKWKEQGKFLMDGSDARLEWQDLIPQSHNPHILNPERGFVSSANQYPVDSLYPYYVYDHSYQDYRNRRINERLSQMDHITPEDMMDLQNDTYNMKAAESLPFLLDTLDLGAFTSEEKTAYDLLRNWNYYNNVNYKAPTLYDLWWEQLTDLIWDEFDNQGVAFRKPADDVTIHILKNYPDYGYIDLQATTAVETLKEIVQEAFSKAVGQSQHWEEEQGQEAMWGDYKNTTLRHMLRQQPFSVSGLQVGGGRSIVAANSSTHGQSWKMIVELGDRPQAWAVYPGGQSGNPGSPYYDNMVSTWANGEYYSFTLMQEPDQDNGKIMFRQYLNPKQE